MEFYIGIYTHCPLAQKFINELTDKNNQLEKLSLVNCGTLVSTLVIILQVDLLTEKVHQKNFTLFIILIFPLLNITYHQHKNYMPFHELIFFI